MKAKAAGMGAPQKIPPNGGVAATGGQRVGPIQGKLSTLETHS
jgi:hypothetical protein